MSEDLKPCPFCGGEVEIERASKSGAIQCMGPSSCLNTGLLIGFDLSQESTAIAAWNRRADLHDTAIAAAKAEGIREGMLKAAAECQNWLDTFGEIEINFTQAREYACDAVSDLRDNFTAVGGAP